jgi:hypothetical protein
LALELSVLHQRVIKKVHPRELLCATFDWDNGDDR